MTIPNYLIDSLLRESRSFCQWWHNEPVEQLIHHLRIKKNQYEGSSAKIFLIKEAREFSRTIDENLRPLFGPYAYTPDGNKPSEAFPLTFAKEFVEKHFPDI